MHVCGWVREKQNVEGWGRVYNAREKERVCV